MYYIVSSMSFSTYIVVAVIALILAIYGIYEMHKKNPGHPMIWMLPFAIVADVFLIAYRFTIEYSINTTLYKFINIATIASIVVFVISFIVTFIIADKKHYTAQGKKGKYAKSTFISSCIAAIVCIIFIFVVYTMRENNLL